MHFNVSPPTSDRLVLQQAIQNAMQQTFGLTRAFTYFDFVQDDPEPSQIALKVSNADSPYFAAALAAFSGSRTFSFKSQEKCEGNEEEE